MSLLSGRGPPPRSSIWGGGSPLKKMSPTQQIHQNIIILEDHRSKRDHIVGTELDVQDFPCTPPMEVDMVTS